jgi:hypothetical protein
MYAGQPLCRAVAGLRCVRVMGRKATCPRVVGRDTQGSSARSVRPIFARDWSPDLKHFPITKR